MAIKTLKELEHLERQRELGLLILSRCMDTWREGAERRVPGSCQRSPMTGPEAAGTN